MKSAAAKLTLGVSMGFALGASFGGMLVVRGISIDHIGMFSLVTIVAGIGVTGVLEAWVGKGAEKSV